MSPSEIRWHQVSDLDLPHLMRSDDPEMAAAAEEEHKRRYGMAGGTPELNLIRRRAPDREMEPAELL